jgi:hypothetical protein
MRCPDCNKFVSFDYPEPEIMSEDISGDEYTAEVRVVLACADCGTELKDTELTVTIDVAGEHDCENADDDGSDHGYSIDNSSAEFSERRATTDAKGKPSKPRYQKQYYGAELTVELTCAACGESITVNGSADEQASGFNELV